MAGSVGELVQGREHHDVLQVHDLRALEEVVGLELAANASEKSLPYDLHLNVRKNRRPAMLR
jgi:hypothetical protein